VWAGHEVVTFAQQAEFIFSTLQDALSSPCWERSLAMRFCAKTRGNGGSLGHKGQASLLLPNINAV